MTTVFIAVYITIVYHGQALDFKNDDQPCLVARSKCHLQLGNTKAALDDAELSLKEDTKYHRV